MCHFELSFIQIKITSIREYTMRKRDDDNTYNIGSNIRTARMRANLTQEKMSEMIGVTPQYLSDLERGLVGTSIPTLIRICTELNVSSDFILFGSSSDSDSANSTLIEKIQRLPKHKPLHRSSMRLRKFRSRASVGSSSFRSSFRCRNAAAVCFCTFCGVPAPGPAGAYKQKKKAVRFRTAFCACKPFSTTDLHTYSQ